MLIEQVRASIAVDICCRYQNCSPPANLPKCGPLTASRKQGMPSPNDLLFIWDWAGQIKLKLIPRMLGSNLANSIRAQRNLVLKHQHSDTGIAYCEQGFGPSDPWGLVFLSGDHMGIGMDSGWFSTLESAMRESMGWDGENPENYEVP